MRRALLLEYVEKQRENCCPTEAFRDTSYGLDRLSGDETAQQSGGSDLPRTTPRREGCCGLLLILFVTGCAPTKTVTVDDPARLVSPQYAEVLQGSRLYLKTTGGKVSGRFVTNDGERLLIENRQEQTLVEGSEITGGMVELTDPWFSKAVGYGMAGGCVVGGIVGLTLRSSRNDTTSTPLMNVIGPPAVGCIGGALLGNGVLFAMGGSPQLKRRARELSY